MYKISIMRYYLALLLSIISVNLSAQSVGLVLSGGGAKGLVHIGVIKALEENSVPIDYITGTSIGAIVGGLYAIGYSPDEMLAKFKSEEFYNWSNGIIPEKYIYYFKKKHPTSSMFEVSIRFQDKKAITQLPSYLIPTHQMDIAFLEIYGEGIAAANYNFDNLFVPFRAIATDIYTKKPYIFSEGDLGTSIRASMTFPLYFRPVNINGRPLYDGGIVNNFPWDIMAIDFNPEYIIGSLVASNAPPPNEYDLLLQIENMVSFQSNFNLPDSLGLLINTNIDNVSLLDFSKADELVNLGYTNTLKYIDSIRTIVNREVDTSYVNKKRKEFIGKQPNLYYNNIAINGLKPIQKNYVERMIRKKSSVISHERFKKEYFKLVSDGYIDRIYPQAIFNYEKDVYDLHLDITQQPTLSFAIGGNVSSTSLNQGFFETNLKLLSTPSHRLNLNTYFGKLYSSFLVQARQDYPTVLPFYTEFGLTLNRFDYYNSSVDPFFTDAKPAYLIKKEFFFEGDIGAPLQVNSMMKMALKTGETMNEYYQVDNFLTTDLPDNTYFRFAAGEFSVDRNTLNFRMYPTSGRKQFIKFGYVYGREDHEPGTTSQMYIEDYFYHNWFNIHFLNESYHNVLAKQIVFGLYLEGFYSNRTFFNNYTASILNAKSFSPTSHSKTLFIKQLYSNSFIGAGLIPILNFSKDLSLRSELYFFQPYKQLVKNEDFTASYDKAFTKYYLFGSISVVKQTRVGPISLSVNYYPKENKQFYVLFNFGYILFNNSGLDG